jgi:hypothetical protein
MCVGRSRKGEIIKKRGPIYRSLYVILRESPRTPKKIKYIYNFK